MKFVKKWLMVGGEEPAVDLQPRPAVKAARIVAGLIVVFDGLPALLTAFNLVNWSADQWAAVNGFVGVLIAAISIWFGIQVERQVTPIASPRDDSLVPLVPIADDGLDD